MTSSASAAAGNLSIATAFSTTGSSLILAMPPQPPQTSKQSKAGKTTSERTTAKPTTEVTAGVTVGAAKAADLKIQAAAAGGPTVPSSAQSRTNPITAKRSETSSAAGKSIKAPKPKPTPSEIAVRLFAERVAATLEAPLLDFSGQDRIALGRSQEPEEEFQGLFDGDSYFCGELTKQQESFYGTFFNPDHPNIPHGIGCLKKGGEHYVGEVVMGKRDGLGRMRSPQGFYRGPFKDDLADGPGVFIYPNGNRYEGAFKEGKPDGLGTYTYANGDWYQGLSENGVYQGRGQLKIGNLLLIGNFVGGFLEDDWGIIEYLEDKAKFVGVVKKGLPAGPGTFYGPDGSKRKGTFLNGLSEGRVRIIHKDRTIFIGILVHGLLQGKGTVIHPNRTKEEVIFENGKIKQKDQQGSGAEVQVGAEAKTESADRNASPNADGENARPKKVSKDESAGKESVPATAAAAAAADFAEALLEDYVVTGIGDDLI